MYSAKTGFIIFASLTGAVGLFAICTGLTGVFICCAIFFGVFVTCAILGDNDTTNTESTKTTNNNKTKQSKSQNTQDELHTSIIKNKIIKFYKKYNFEISEEQIELEIKFIDEYGENFISYMIEKIPSKIPSKETFIKGIKLNIQEILDFIYHNSYPKPVKEIPEFPGRLGLDFHICLDDDFFENDDNSFEDNKPSKDVLTKFKVIVLSSINEFIKGIDSDAIKSAFNHQKLEFNMDKSLFRLNYEQIALGVIYTILNQNILLFSPAEFNEIKSRLDYFAEINYYYKNNIGDDNG